MVTGWVVTWRYRSGWRVIDFSDEDTALRFAQGLAESNDREDVAITPIEYEPDPERAERIWNRLQDRLAHEWAIGAIT